MDLIQRPRRLRGSENLRKMVRETRMDKSSLIYPLFVKEGTGIEEEIPSMEGQFRYSVDRLPFELERLQNAGVNSIMLFGIPDHKDEVGSGAYDPNSSRTCTISQMYVCVSTLHTDTAECSAVMM